MAEVRPIARSATTASFVLGRKLDSIPFSGYHVLIIAVLALVGFIEGYDLVMTGSLLVLAKAPLHLTGTDIRWLAVGPTFMLCLGGFFSSAVSDHLSRKTIMLIGVIADDLFHPADPAGAKRRAADHPAPADRHRRRRRRFGGVPDRRRTDAGAAPAHLWRDLRDGAGRLLHRGAVHRRPARRQRQRLSVSGVAGRAGDNRRSGAWSISCFPESPRWYLRKGQPQVAVDIVNRIISRSGNRVPPLTVEALGDATPKPPARSCRPIGPCSPAASCAGPRSAF